MSWTANNYININADRASDMNRCLIITPAGLSALAEEQASLFDSTFKFTDQIASIRAYPFAIPKAVIDVTRKLRINQTTYLNIDVKEINPNVYFNLGQYTVTRKFYGYADYNGFTEIRLFLPFLGCVDLDVNEIMNKVLQVRLVVDYYTGKGLYLIGVTGVPLSHEKVGFSTVEEDANMRIIATFETDIGIEIPMGASSLSDFKRNLAMSTLKVATAVAFPQLAIPVALATSAVPQTNSNSTALSVRGNAQLSNVISTPSSPQSNVAKSQINFDRIGAGVFDTAVSALSRTRLRGSSDRVSDSGLTTVMSGSPKLIFYRPKLIEQSESFNHLYGRPLGEVRQLDLLHGYTVVAKAHFEGQGFSSATADEMSAIESFFANGVILP